MSAYIAPGQVLNELQWSGQRWLQSHVHKCAWKHTHTMKDGGGEILVDTHTKLTRVGDKDR